MVSIFIWMPRQFLGSSGKGADRLRTAPKFWFLEILGFSGL